VIAAIASRQHGIVTAAQLTTSGLGKDGIYRRARAGRLHRMHRGIYAVGHRGLGNEGRWMAAALALGEGAVLSHRSAAELWALLPPSQGAVDVAVPCGGGRETRSGIRIHRSPSLQKDATTIRNRIAVTTPARTLVDLRGAVSAAEFRRAVRQAEVFGYGLGGVEADHTRSELEYLFVRLCRRHRLPPPEVNVRVGPYLVDFLWRERRLVVETDGYRYHRGAAAFENDRTRELELGRLGYTVHRFTYRQVTAAAAEVAAAIRAIVS
jgi:very-short-patch-repair endonuclease